MEKKMKQGREKGSFSASVVLLRIVTGGVAGTVVCGGGLLLCGLLLAGEVGGGEGMGGVAAGVLVYERTSFEYGGAGLVLMCCCGGGLAGTVKRGGGKRRRR